MFRRFALLAGLIVPSLLPALTLEVDYRYDTRDFFDTPAKRAAMERAAARWSRVVTQELLPANFEGGNRETVISFRHPGNGESWTVSSADSRAESRFSDEFEDYRGEWSIPADTMILYVGGSNISSAGRASTGIAGAFSSVVNDPAGPTNRGFNVSIQSLPMWGGSISFNESRDWRFAENASSSGIDFYSIALHEIGHLLALSAGWTDFLSSVEGTRYDGPNALGAFNEDNEANLSQLRLSSNTNRHWDDNRYDSFIFEAGQPAYSGTVGAGVLQDLLMEPVANFSGSRRRFELTRVDVGALRDAGWATLEDNASTPIQAWRLENLGTIENAGLAANGADFDQDGVPNIVEYAIGSHPRRFTSALEVRDLPTADSLEVLLSLNPEATDVELIVQSSPDLINWTDAARKTSGNGLAAEREGFSIRNFGDNDFGLRFAPTVEGERSFYRLQIEELCYFECCAEH